MKKEMATHSSILAWRISWTGAWQATIRKVAKSRTPLKQSKHLHYGFIFRAQWVFSIPWRGWKTGFLVFSLQRVGGRQRRRWQYWPKHTLFASQNLSWATRSPGDSGQPSRELISIYYKLENQHFAFSWPEAQSFPSNLNCIYKYHVFPLDV